LFNISIPWDKYSYLVANRSMLSSVGVTASF
jgi:hypothetical protein